MNNNNMGISLLIPTMNRPKALERTLNFYFSSEVIPNQLVVVDQSDDKITRDAVEVLVNSFRCYTDVIYIYQPSPSLTKARNMALSVATEEILVCSDDDVDVYPDTLKNVQKLMQDDNIAMIAGIDDNMEKDKTTILGYFSGTKSYKNRHIGHVTKSVLGRFPDIICGQTDTMWAMGFFFIIRRNYVLQWEIKWDERLVGYAYAEDLDFSFSYYKRAAQENLKCIFSENVRVKHLATKEYRTPSKKSTYMYIINRYYLLYKHKMGIKSKIAFNWTNICVLFYKVYKGEKPLDLFYALIFLMFHFREIKGGKLELSDNMEII